MTPEQLAQQTAELMKSYVDKAVEEALKKVDGKIDSYDLSLGKRLVDGFNEQFDERMKSLPAPEKGEKGDKGEAGEAGQSVTLEDVRPLIESAIKSLDLPKGEKGDTGDAGKDGRDALDLDFIPVIDEQKSYPWGVYASHRGGIWKSYKVTSGMEGWQCIVDGIADMSEEFDGERTIKRITRMSSGKEVVTEIKMPSVIDKGVHRDNQSYEKFDAVTFGGSLWIAQKDAPEGKPGTSEDWRLSVKRGRNAIEKVKV